jgi:hypothetical protein
VIFPVRNLPSSAQRRLDAVSFVSGVSAVIWR